MDWTLWMAHFAAVLGATMLGATAGDIIKPNSYATWIGAGIGFAIGVLVIIRMMRRRNNDEPW